MYVNDKDFNREREMKEIEKKALKEIERITKTKIVPLGTEKDRRADRLKKVFYACKNFIELDIKKNGVILDFDEDDYKNVDVIIKMMKDIIGYIETGKI